MSIITDKNSDSDSDFVDLVISKIDEIEGSASFLANVKSKKTRVALFGISAAFFFISIIFAFINLFKTRVDSGSDVIVAIAWLASLFVACVGSTALAQFAYNNMPGAINARVSDEFFAEINALHESGQAINPRILGAIADALNAGDRLTYGDLLCFANKYKALGPGGQELVTKFASK